MSCSDSKTRALIVDDDLDITRMLGIVLSQAGIETMAEFDGNHVLESVVRFQPHAVILDLCMRGVSGLDICRRIRHLPCGAAVLVIIMSGQAGFESRLESISAGANHYFVKPADPKRLIELVTSAGNVAYPSSPN